MNIKTSPPPDLAPYEFDLWTAIDDDTYDGTSGSFVGIGRTEQEAIADLIERMQGDAHGR